MFAIGLPSSAARSSRLVLAAALSLLMLALPVLLASTAHAQTPLTTVENGNGDTRMQLNYDGGFYIPGINVRDGTQNDSIPATGAGTRLMWYSAKAAFRAGRVGVFKDGTQWDAPNVGAYSVALGVDTEATEFAALAIGDRTTASNVHATAMGVGTTASGDAATAMGFRTTAGGTSATAMGIRTTAATAPSLAIGKCNDANTSADNTLFVAGNGTSGAGGCDARSDALVLDKNGNLEVSGSFILPDGTQLAEAGDLEGLPTNSNGAFDLTSNDGVVASGIFGSGSIPTTGPGTRLMWYPAKATFRAGRVDGAQWDISNVGDYSVAFGRNTQASADAATAMGDGTTASSRDATAMGSNTTASGFAATAMGSETTASGIQSTAMGFETTAATDRSLSIGRYNSANTSADNTLFVAGYGVSDTDRADALVLDKDGNLTVNGSFGSGAIPTTGAGTRTMWYPAKAAFRAGRVFDNTSENFGVNGSAFWDATNVGPYSVALGQNVKASGESATAVGKATEATARAATAAGRLTEASGREATALGLQTIASGDAATAMGNGAEATASQATAIGLGPEASAEAATAMGNATEAATQHSLTIGRRNDSNRGNDDNDPATGPLFVVGNGSVGSPSDALVLDQSGNLTISGSLTQNSDRRLKTGITPIGDSVLKKLARLRPVRYRFKDGQTHPAGEQIGLIAQDVQKEFPALVSEGAGGMLSLAYPKLTAVLVKGLQEQQAELQEQQDQLRKKQDQIDALQAENESIKQRLAALEAKVSGSTQVAAQATSLPSIMMLLALAFGGLAGMLLWRGHAEQA
jgi:hypothetical protein